MENLPNRKKHNKNNDFSSIFFTLDCFHFSRLSLECLHNETNFIIQKTPTWYRQISVENKYKLHRSFAFINKFKRGKYFFNINLLLRWWEIFPNNNHLERKLKFHFPLKRSEKMWKGLSVFGSTNSVKIWDVPEKVFIFRPHKSNFYWIPSFSTQLDVGILTLTHRNKSYHRSHTIIDNRQNHCHNGLFYFYNDWWANLDETRPDCMCGCSVGQLKVKQHNEPDKAVDCLFS